MLRRLAAAALLATAGCVSDPPAEHAATSHMVARPAGPATLRIRGEGTEMHPVRSAVLLGEVHEALVRGGGRRLEGGPVPGLELVVVRDVAVDPIVRALLPTDPPSVEWLGTPVRWNEVASDAETSYELRSWPVITELGPRSIVEIAVKESGEARGRRELLLVPGEALAVTAASSSWPAPPDTRRPPVGSVQRAFGWDTESPLVLVVLVPRFEGR